MEARGPLEADERRVARAAASAIFVTTDPFKPLFRPALSARAILYPMSYELEVDELAALGAAAAEEGDERFYLMLREERGQPVYEFGFAEYEDYAELDLVTEVVMYGSSGRWGLVVSHLDHCVVGGSARFLAALRNLLPPADPFRAPGSPRTPLSFEGQAKEFVVDLLTRVPETNVPWLRPLLAHIYGAEPAELLMELPST